MSTEPSPRWGPFTAEVEGEFWVWGGKTENHRQQEVLAANLYSFNPVNECWTWRKCTGPPPPGLYHGACTSSGGDIYAYGGGGWNNRQCSLQKLNTKALTWRLLSDAGPSKKSGCEMVTYKNKVILFGGCGDPPDSTQSVQWDGKWTNELHTFDVEEGTWSSPPVSGTKPPPCCEFSFTKFNENHAVLFGGHKSGKAFNDVYLLELGRMEWNKHDCHGPCPVGRSHHAAVCLNYKAEHPLLFVAGGRDQKLEVLSDCWMLDIMSGNWREVSISGFQGRRGHRAAAFSITPALILVTIFGGIDGEGKFLANTTVLEFECRSRKWVLNNVADNTKLGSREHLRAKEARIQASAAPKKWWRRKEDDGRVQEAERKDQVAEDRGREKNELMRRLERAEGRVREASREIEILRRGLENEECRAQEAEGEKERARKEKDKAESRALKAEDQIREVVMENDLMRRQKERAEGRVKEASREIEILRRDLEKEEEEAEGRVLEAEGRAEEAEGRAVEAERQREIAELRAREAEERAGRLEFQWVVERREIFLTEEELGRGGWATVHVATFRGARVAAKCVHSRIVSTHNIQLFKREMDMAARIRHPNLLQFIGASLEGQMVILTELMPTSLRRELEREPHHYMSRDLVISIGLDVIRALNYLHLFQPQPLIHRDISSANVLLEPLSNIHWRAKVSDYGTVNLLQQLDTVCPGNPCYSAPEANDPIQQSPKMDIFSFGVLLMEMLTGEFPASDERGRLLSMILHQPLQSLIQRCLRQHKEDRPNASDIIAILDS